MIASHASRRHGATAPRRHGDTDAGTARTLPATRGIALLVSSPRQSLLLLPLLALKVRTYTETGVQIKGPEPAFKSGLLCCSGFEAGLPRHLPRPQAEARWWWGGRARELGASAMVRPVVCALVPAATALRRRLPPPARFLSFFALPRWFPSRSSPQQSAPGATR